MEVWIARHVGRAFKETVLAKAAADVIARPDMAVLLDVLEEPGAAFGADPPVARDRLLLTSLASA